MIEVNERVVVDGATEAVWKIVSDPTAVASCISGCELGEQRDDGSYDATIGVKFGGIRVRFRTVVQLEVDEPTMTGQLRITGADQQGATRVGGSARFEVREVEASRSAVEFDGALDITGRLATLIASGANVVVSRMTREFTDCLAAKLAIATPAPEAAAPAQPTAPSSLAASSPARHTWQTRLRDFWAALVNRVRGTAGAR